MSGSGNWCTIESDLGVFTSLIESFGVKNVELSELWSLDEGSLASLVEEYGKVYDLIFLFKWQSSIENGSSNDAKRRALIGEEVPEDLFFAKQVTHNACATQAILSVLLNAPTEPENNDEDANAKKSLSLGSTLSSLKTFTACFPPDLKGEAISASDEIRSAHNSFARKDAFLTDEKKQRVATDDDDVFHFIAYVPHTDSNVYELDGLQAGPIPLGKFEAKANMSSDLNWMSVARSAIQSHIERYATSEIKFNLMAVVRDKRAEITSKINMLVAAGIGGSCDGEEDEVVLHLRAALAAEEEKRKQWQTENERRRHNYLPFCVELLRALVASGKLPELTAKANERAMKLRKQAFMAKTIRR